MAPDGPVEITKEVEIERPAAEVYPMVDFDDPRNHKAAVGTVTRTGSDTFDMALDMLPGLIFPITEMEAVPGRSYTIESILPEELGARLHKTVERTDIEPLGDDRCKVTLVVTACFHPMKMKHYDHEIAMITAGCHNSLAKLKVHAEQGVDVIREIEAAQAA
ncbi:hypothetical protein [Aurantiacibacter rhizosphaerae]|uniref:SRPBCC family protein n=1 Tax=Aurantiacibacter rhizosphaerae TaxID=2691582 RepID=A0A844XAM9_9SPHN|nr:hypothetical protein [Aurantiacibacter rhizosphaerae]MWV26585.1 hypothetical protein [Aurantiacibacter rhizosphaerae]